MFGSSKYRFNTSLSFSLSDIFISRSVHDTSYAASLSCLHCKSLHNTAGSCKQKKTRQKMCGHVPLYYGINLWICFVRLRHKGINMLLREKATMDMFYYIAPKSVWTCPIILRHKCMDMYVITKTYGHVPLSKHKKVQKNAY